MKPHKVVWNSQVMELNVICIFEIGVWVPKVLEPFMGEIPTIYDI